MCKEVGVLGTGPHKKWAIEGVVNPRDVQFKMLTIYEDIPEVEHQNPKKILKPKLVNNVTALRPSLSFLAEEGGEKPPDAVMIMDVLGIDMSNAETLNAPFGSSSGILKKPEYGTPASAIAQHYGKKVHAKPIDGYAFDAFAAGVAVAPVSRRGEVLLNYMTALWDNAVWMGCSLPLVNILADEAMVSKLIANKVLSSQTVSMKSINGIRQQNLIRDLAKLQRTFPGEDISMKVVYRNIDLRIGGGDDIERLTHVTNLVDSNMANATPFLGKMIVDTVKKYSH